MVKNSDTKSINDKVEMDTLSSCLNGLFVTGFRTHFLIVEEGLKSLSTEIVYPAEDVKIISFYRFEGQSDPDDNCILFAIETYNNEKGILIDAYGVYNDPAVSKFVAKIKEISKKSLIKNTD